MNGNCIGSQLQKLRKSVNGRTSGEYTQKKISSRLEKAQSWVSRFESQTDDGDYSFAELVKYLNQFTMDQLSEFRGEDCSLARVLRRQLSEIDDTISYIIWRLSMGRSGGEAPPDPVPVLGGMLQLLRDIKIDLLPRLEEREQKLGGGLMSSSKPAGDALLSRVRSFLGVPGEKDDELLSVQGAVDAPRALVKNYVDLLLS